MSFERTNGPVLLIQDTTEFIYKRERPRDVGFTKAVNSGRDKRGRLRHHTLCGMLMHSSLAVTVAGAADPDLIAGIVKAMKRG